MSTIDWDPIPTIWIDLGENWLEEDCADKNQGQKSTFAQFYFKISAGEGGIFHGYRTYIWMPIIDSYPISTIWVDLGEKLAWIGLCG